MKLPTKGWPLHPLKKDETREEFWARYAEVEHLWTLEPLGIPQHPPRTHAERSEELGLQVCAALRMVSLMDPEDRPLTS